MNLFLLWGEVLWGIRHNSVRSWNCGEVVSPPKNNKNKPSRTSRPETGTCIPKKYKQYKFQEHGGRLATQLLAIQSRLKTSNAAGTRPSAPRGTGVKGCKTECSKDCKTRYATTDKRGKVIKAANIQD